ncbi:MAG: MBL fold metallo-hydrolase [Bacillota bacterium]
MKIKTLVENEKSCELANVHGLCIYIETENKKILFDFGPDDTFLKNAHLAGIDISAVDVAVLSHGHYDHGGGLEYFLQVNKTAKIYAQETAFDDISSSGGGKMHYIGVDARLKNHPQMVLVSGDFKISDDLELFRVEDTSKCKSPANDTLFAYGKSDLFYHEQQFIVRENGKTALFVGCGHCGIVNILETTKNKGFTPDICVGGYHLYSESAKKTVSDALLNEIAINLQKYYRLKFYTCHCTGEKAFKFFEEHVPGMHYLKCGEKVCL